MLAPGHVMGVFGSDPAHELLAGAYWGAFPNLEIGTHLRAVSYGSAPTAQTQIRTTFQGKYRLLQMGAFSLGVLGQATYRSLDAPGHSFWEGALGLPITYAPFEVLSLDLLPITPLGFNGVTFAHGIGTGIRLRLLPTLWVQAANHFGIGTGPTNVLSSGLRFTPWPGFSADVTLMNHLYNTGSPGIQTGTLGITNFFGGKVLP